MDRPRATQRAGLRGESRHTHPLVSVVTERSGGMDSEGRGPGLRDPALDVDWPLGLWVAWGGQRKGSEEGEAWGAGFGNGC